MKPIRIAIALGLLLSSGAAVAQTASDVGCILVSNAFMHASKDADAQKLAEASLYFYLGRIPDRTTPAQLKALFEQQAKTLTDATAGTVMQACVKNLQDKIQLVQGLSPQPTQPATPPKKP
jgi:hypothetical protein